MEIIPCFVIILISLVLVDAKNMFVGPIFRNEGKFTYLKDAISFRESVTADLSSDIEVHSSEGLPPDFICHYCLEVSKRAENILNDPELFEKVGKLSSDICHLLPSDLEVKCVEMSDMFEYQTISILQDFFSEKNLCNSTRLCPGNTGAPSLKIFSKKKVPYNMDSDHALFSNSWTRFSTGKGSRFFTKTSTFTMHKAPLKLMEDKSCTVCRNAMDEIRNGLEDPETKIKVMKVLLKACEEAKNQVQQCKKIVFEYGPLVLANLVKYLNNNDVCHLIHLCKTGPPAEVAEHLRRSGEYALHLKSTPTSTYI